MKGLPSTLDPPDILVIEIRDALKTMATIFVQVSKWTKMQNQGGLQGQSNSDDERVGDTTMEDEPNHEEGHSKGKKHGTDHSQSGAGG